MTGPSLSQRAFERFARGVFRRYCPLRVTGRNHVPAPPFILCSNHASHMDAIALMVASGLPFERFGLVAATDYFFRNAVVYRWFSGMVRLIPIDRGSRGASLGTTIDLCRTFLAGGDTALIIFPEGTRSITGEMARFKRGIALIASELGVPVVPAYIHGSAVRMPKGRVFPVPGHVTVHIGAPIVPLAAGDRDALAGVIESRIRALRDARDES